MELIFQCRKTNSEQMNAEISTMDKYKGGRAWSDYFYIYIVKKCLDQVTVECD